MSKPTGLKFFLPKSVLDKDRLNTPESGALTLLLANNNSVYYYEGADPRKMHMAAGNEVRNIILDKKNRTTPDKFMVIIKPGKDSNFESVVNVMDEMTIDGVKRYALADVDQGEYALMHE